MRQIVVILLACLWSLPAYADMAPQLPDPLLKRIKAAPERFLDDSAILIHGFGSGGSISAAGVEQAIALERAGARASAMRRMLAVDLNNDGAIDTDELAVAAGAASATSRGRLITTHARADADSDGAVSPTELTAHAGAEALRLVSEVDAGMARAVLACDQDGDGKVTLAEVKRALSALDPAA
ncbi:MAG: EF-hand domain-containing protein [Paracoccaceae bacterium]